MFIHLKSIKKGGRDHYFPIEVAHDLKRHVTAFVHGDHFLIRNWMKTPEEKLSLKTII